MVSEGSADPPEVMKRRVRNILRQERERRQLTKKDAAESVLWSESKLSRIETGATAAAPADVRLLLLEYGVDEKRVAEAVEFAKAARLPDRWEPYRSAYSREAINLFSNERSATLVMKYEPSLIPGLFQTEEYARALLRGLRSDASAIESKLDGRLLRQEILENRGRPELDFIIGEAAVSRPVGGTKTMLAQIERLKEVASTNRISLRLLPFSAGPHPGMGSAFTVLEFGDPDLQDLVYLEASDRESIERDNQKVVERYTQRFAELVELAIPSEELATALDKIAESRFRNGA